MTYPILFDLEAGVKKAAEDWENKYADKLEKAIQKRALEVNLQVRKLDTSSLEDVKKRLGELKIEPITPETKAAIKELASELRTLAKALEEVQKYSAGKAAVSPDAVRAARVAEINSRAADKAAIALENQRAAAARAAAAEERLVMARDKSAQAAARAAKGVNTLTEAYKEQSTYIDRLLKRMVTYWSVQQIQQFISSVREVTAQFELQRVSLGAIIQDQTEANRLFSEIKAFALKSPVSIMDLTKYTKQVAAYGVETEKLFETTKMLTDVSVGLGTDLGRLALAYGQIRSQSLLRMAEARQLTESGIPVFDLLAKQLTEANGKLVTTAEVMDLISKRAISFEMVNQMFKDMTSAGGMFYNMQEKQGNTLFGLWAKLGDAAAVMYDEIGNTSSINEGMKNLIQLLTSLMKNWRLVGGEMLVVAATIGIITAKQKAHTTATNLQQAATLKVRSAGMAYNAILREEAALTATATAAQRQSVAARKANAKAALDAAIAERTVANSTNVWVRSMQKLKDAFMGNWITLLIAGIAALGVGIYNAIQKTNKLKNALKEIEDESDLEQLKSVRNFEALAKTAVEAADGSKKQKDALDELNRTYKDIIPQERLTIENLRAMDGVYDSLTQSIRTYIAEQMKQKKISTIVEQTGKSIIDEQRNINDFLSGQGYSDAQISRFWIEYENRARTTNKSIEDMFTESWRAIGGTEEQVKKLDTMYKRYGGDLYRLDARLEKITATYREQEREIARVEAQYDSNYMALGRYGQGYEDLLNKIKDNPITVDGRIVDENKDSYIYGQQKRNLEVFETIVPTLQKIMSDANVAWQDGWANLVDTVDTTNPQIISTIDFDAINKYLNDNIKSLTDEQRRAVYKLQEIYSGLTISDRTVLTFRSKLTQLSIAAGVEMGSMTKYFMNAGDKIEDYAKCIKEAIEDLDNQIKEMNTTNQMIAEGGHGPLQGFSDEEIKKIEMQVAVLKELFPFLQGFTKSRGRTPADPRLQTLQEIANKMAEVNKEYDELLKKEGQTKALADTQKLVASSFKQMQETAKKYKFKLPTFEVPQTIEDVQKWYKAIQKEIKRLGLKNADKVLIELGFKSDKAAIDKAQKDIEKQLKTLADRISRTKTAKEFYEKILSQTGDAELARRVRMNIYGGEEDLRKLLAKQVRELTNGIELPKGVINAEGLIDYKALRAFAEANQDELGKTYDELVKIAEQGQKDLAQTYEGYLKDLEKAKTYADKRIELARTTRDKIAEIESSGYDRQEKDRLIDGYRKREEKEAAGLEWEAFKGMPMYIQMFDDLDNASTRMLTEMRDKLKSLAGEWENLSPTQLKELQSRLREIEAQLTNRNPFGSLRDAANRLKELKNRYGELSEVEERFVDKQRAWNV
ncbi:MAG: tape measure protein, partial [Lachnospiraceae bacterium]|nr:tape measure protein [Lachnospiraceae bacterium]